MRYFTLESNIIHVHSLTASQGKPDFPLVQRLAQKSLPFPPLLYLFQTDKLIEMLSYIMSSYVQFILNHFPYQSKKS